MIKGTGIKASAEDIERAKVWAAECHSTPVIKVHGHWMHIAAENIFKERVDALAREKYGLPVLAQIDGEKNNYGMGNDGEFLVYEKDEPADPYAEESASQ